MAIVKLWEPYAVTYLRNQVRDSLAYHGEEAIAMQLIHPNELQPDDQQCPRCASDSYPGGENDCPVCFGIGRIDAVSGSGVRMAKRVWCEFTDHVVGEALGQKGTWMADEREVQLEAFPLLVEHDVIVRVPRWNIATHTPVVDGQFFRLQAVTRSSVRTGGNRFGQTRDDVYGQKATCSLLSSESEGITNFPIKGVSFPDVTITGTPLPVAVAEPDTKVIYVPVPDGSTPAPNTGAVLGAAMRWDPVFTFTQTVPATVWSIHHSLGHRPDVSVYVNDELVNADVDGDADPDNPLSLVTITFGSPQAGYAEIT